MQIGSDDRRERRPIADAIRGTVHVVQFYETDDTCCRPLSDYVAGAFAAGDAASIVATQAHRAVLDDRLAGRGIDVHEAQEAGGFSASTRGSSLRGFALLRAYPARFFSTDAESIVHVADISSLHEPMSSPAN